MIVVAFDAMNQKMLKSLDDMLFKEAKADGKEVGGLETVQEQLDALASGSNEDQVDMLRLSLAHMIKLEAQGKSAIAQMLEAYLTGDEERILAVALESMGGDKKLMARLLRPLLAHRNVRMADRMEKAMRGNPKKSYFFAVGALHYVNEDSIIALLRKKGYVIQRIDPPMPSPAAVKKMREEIARQRARVRHLEKELATTKK